MADCYYHGQSMPGRCPLCEEAERKKMHPSEISGFAEPDVNQEDREHIKDRIYSRKEKK